MIQPDARSRLTATDLALVCEGMTGRRPSETDLDLWLLDIDLDQVLDAPETAARLRRCPMPGPSSSLLFYVLVRGALLRRDLADRPLADYCATMLREFGTGDRAHRVAPVDDHRHLYLVDILQDAATAEGDRRLQVLAHLGNYALWFAGMFPDRIASRQRRAGGPDLGYYDAMGSQGFAEAAEHRTAARLGLDGLYRSAALAYPLLREAFNEVSGSLRLRAA